MGEPVAINFAITAIKFRFVDYVKINVIGLHEKFRDVSQEAGGISYETLNLLAALNRNSRLLLGVSGTLRINGLERIRGQKSNLSVFSRPGRNSGASASHAHTSRVTFTLA